MQMHTHTHTHLHTDVKSIYQYRNAPSLVRLQRGQLVLHFLVAFTFAFYTPVRLSVCESECVCVCVHSSPSTCGFVIVQIVSTASAAAAAYLD